MKRICEGTGFKVMIMLVSMFLILSLISAGNSYVNNFFTSFLLTPIQQVASGTVFYAGEKLTPEKSAEELKEDVKRLQEENRKLNDMLVEYYDIKKQNEELSKFYEIKSENIDFTIIPTAVIGKDANENFYGFTADKGSYDGVSVNDPVITENGLIGRVCEVAPKSCKVETILSPETQIGAAGRKTSDSGIISGSADISDSGLTRLINLPAQNTLREGDIIVTSGYGGIYPKNLKIGKVSEITLDSYTGMPMAVISPFEDIKNISSAAVIINFNGKGEIGEK